MIPDGLVSIHRNGNQPANPFVTIPYRDHWFWIDDRDLKSNRTFSFTMPPVTLADTREAEYLPLVTITAQ